MHYFGFATEISKMYLYDRYKASKIWNKTQGAFILLEGAVQTCSTAVLHISCCYSSIKTRYITD